MLDHNWRFTLQFLLYMSLVLKFLAPKLLQVCPCSGKVEVACVLAEAGHVCQVILSIAHGLDDMTYPVSFDLHIGRNMDELHLALEVSKPFCCAPS